MRLLLAEPTQAIGELIDNICETEDVICDIARDVESLFLYLNEEKYDIICLAPNIDADEGIDILVKIRALPQFSYVPIFLVTSSNNSDLVRRALSAGATDIIEKSDFAGLQFFIQRFRQSESPLEAKVLLVEDAPLQQELLATLLQGMGCNVFCFDDVEGAYQAFLESDFDLVITDILLKGDLSGVALAGRIRRLKEIKGDVPIIAITGYDEPSRQESLFRYGVNYYLKKPIDQVKFCQLARSSINLFNNYKLVEKHKNDLYWANRQNIVFLNRLTEKIRSPLSGMVGTLQLINSEDVTQTKRQYLEAVIKLSSELLSSIDTIIDLSESERDHQ